MIQIRPKLAVSAVSVAIVVAGLMYVRYVPPVKTGEHGDKVDNPSVPFNIYINNPVDGAEYEDEMSPSTVGVKQIKYVIYVVPRGTYRGRVRLRVAVDPSDHVKNLRYIFAKPVLDIDNQTASTVLTITGDHTVTTGGVGFSVEGSCKEGDTVSSDFVGLMVYAPPDDTRTSLYVREPEFELRNDGVPNIAHVTLHFKRGSAPAVRLKLADDPVSPMFPLVTYRISRSVLRPSSRSCDISFRWRSDAAQKLRQIEERRSSDWTPYKTWHITIEGVTSTGERVTTALYLTTHLITGP
ncbi:MAG: hypothetical protein ACLQVD_20830 [Capsulimonadaceae bacterium]